MRSSEGILIKTRCPSGSWKGHSWDICRTSVCQELWLDWQMSQAQGVPGLSTTSERLKCCRCRWKEPSVLSCSLVLIHLWLFYCLAWRLSLIVLTLKKASLVETKSSSEGLWPPTPQCYKFPGLRCEIRLLSAARGHAWCQSGRDTSEDIHFLFLLTKTMVRLETWGQKLNCRNMSMRTALFEKIFYFRTSVFSLQIKSQKSLILRVIC